MENQIIKISKIKSNTGQIDGLPKNPRIFKDDKYHKLVNSIKEDPEMLNLRELLVFPLGKEFIVIAGNMRLKACKELGFEELNCKVLDADTPVTKLKAYTIKDNVSFGEHDWDKLAEEWDTQQLQEWGLDVLKHDWNQLEYIEEDIEAPNPEKDILITIHVAKKWKENVKNIQEDLKQFLNEKYSGCEIK